MIEKIKKISNPLTIIAIFAALAEVAGTAALVGIDKEVQEVFVWFVMLFPTILVLLFFVTLNFNHHVLYAPSDYESDRAFLEAIKGRKELEINFASLETEVNSLPETLEGALNEKIEGLNKDQIKKLKSIISQELASVRARVEVTKESAEEFSLQALPRSELQARILSFIYMSKHPVTLKELSDNLPMSEAATERATSKMVKRGTIHIIDYEGAQCFVQANL
jgi:ElaB/YqjD/DUF883 family membrane-anchored ribosome-binding protein